MKITPLAIADVMLIEPRVHYDTRGFFFESYRAADLHAALGKAPSFVQDNHSRSLRGVVRGLHYQIQEPQAKLIRVIAGEIFDVAVDLRRSSATFGQWVGSRLTAENRHQLWVPEGFAHGFMVLSEAAEILYKTTAYYAPQHERCIRWDDPQIGITWPSADGVMLSDKDQQGAAFGCADTFA